MIADSIRIPPERLVPVATETASSGKTVGSVLCFFMALFAIAAIGMIADSGADSTTGKTMDGGSTVVGVGIWLLVLGGFASRFLKNAKRAADAAGFAKSNAGYVFALEGKQITLVDPTGIPQPQRTFKISGKHRAMLLEVPKAVVVDGDR